MRDAENDNKKVNEKGLVRTSKGALLTRAQFYELAEVPPEIEWFANIDNKRTRRAYKVDLHEFMQFVGIGSPLELRVVTRAHLIAWRKSLEEKGVTGATIRRKLACLSSLFEYLCEKNAVVHNPVKGVKRPKVESYEGKTPALSDRERSLSRGDPRNGGNYFDTGKRSDSLRHKFFSY